MKQVIKITNITLLLVSISLLATSAFADVKADGISQTTKDLTAPSSPQPCSTLINECYMKQNVSRQNCFFTTAKHPFCEGSELGKLAHQRWAMSPSKPAGLENASGLLGPQLVDQECLTNFDSKWSGLLTQGKIEDASAQALSKTLSSCQRDLSLELSRP